MLRAAALAVAAIGSLIGGPIDRSSADSSVDRSTNRSVCRLLVNDADHLTRAERRMLRHFDYDGGVWRHEMFPDVVLGMSLYEDSRIVSSTWCTVWSKPYGRRVAPGSMLRTLRVPVSHGNVS